MGFTITYERGVSKSLINQCRRFLDRVQKVTPIKHKIGVLVTNRRTLSHDEAALEKSGVKNAPYTLANFCPPRSRASLEKYGIWSKGCDCMIILCGKLSRRKYGISYDRFDFLDSVLHEVSHYTQFRDRKKLQEEGVEERMDSLMKRLLEAKCTESSKR